MFQHIDAITICCDKQLMAECSSRGGAYVLLSSGGSGGGSVGEAMGIGIGIILVAVILTSCSWLYREVLPQPELATKTSEN